MDILTSFNSQMATVMLVMIGLAGVKVYSDIKEIAIARRIRHFATAFVAKNNTPRISVVIELNRSADTILPLLDHLYGHRYDNLEVVILIKHTAGKYAQSKLVAYRRKHHINHLKLVKHTKGMTHNTVVRHKVTGDLITVLSATDRLSVNFFASTALVFLDDGLSVIKPRQHIATGTSLISAVDTTCSIWRYIHDHFTTGNNVKGIQRGYVYRRETLLSRAELNSNQRSIYKYHIAIITASQATWRSMQRSLFYMANRAVKTVRIGGLIVATILLGALVVIAEYNYVLLSQLLFISYTIIISSFTFGIKEYTFTDKISQVLFAPFSIAFIATVYTTSAIGHFLTTVTSVNLAHKSKPLLTK